jgi:LexA DNA binding domain-containing protein
MPRFKNPNEMTELQRRILVAMIRYIRANGRPPTCPWLRDELDYASVRSITLHFRDLDRMGLVRFGRGATVVTDAGYASLGMLSPSGVESATLEMLAGKMRAATIDALWRHFEAIKKLG